MHLVAAVLVADATPSIRPSNRLGACSIAWSDLAVGVAVEIAAEALDAQTRQSQCLMGLIAMFLGTEADRPQGVGGPREEREVATEAATGEETVDDVVAVVGEETMVDVAEHAKAEGAQDRR